MSRDFTEEEIRDYVWQNESRIVREEVCEKRRWSQTVFTTFETEDGKFYTASWERGLTENQDNDYSSQTLDEVFPVHHVSASVNTVYSTEPENETQFSLDKDTLEASKYIADDAEAGIEAIKAFDVSTVLTFLQQADATILSKKERAFLEASRQFFHAIEKIQTEI